MKRNNKSIRLNDHIYNYIINYRGDGFNQKFENIIIDARESEKKRKDEIKELDSLIETRLDAIHKLNNTLLYLLNVESSVNSIIESINKLDEEVEDLKNYV